MADKEKYCENCKEKEQEYSDSFWFFVIVMLAFAMPFPQTDYKLREEVAELKGKVSVLEQFAVADRRG